MAKGSQLSQPQPRALPVLCAFSGGAPTSGPVLVRFCKQEFSLATLKSPLGGSGRGWRVTFGCSELPVRGLSVEGPFGGCCGGKGDVQHNLPRRGHFCSIRLFYNIVLFWQFLPSLQHQGETPAHPQQHLTGCFTPSSSPAPKLGALLLCARAGVAVLRTLPSASFAPAVPFGAGGRSPKSFLTSWPHAGPSAMGGNLPFLGLNNSSDSRRQRQRQLLLKRAEFTGHSDCSRQGPAPRALISRTGSYARPPPLRTQASPFSRLQPCRCFGR